MHPQQVIDESKPMLEDVLASIGLRVGGSPLDLQAMLNPFSHWVESQDIRDEDFAFLASLIGAFICEFLIEAYAATRVIRDQRILLRLPFQAGIEREFDPYAVATAITRHERSLAQFLQELTS